MTGSTLQLVNGIALIATFFSVRCVWGAKMVGVHLPVMHMVLTFPMQSYDFFVTLNGVYDQVSTPYVVIYGGGNILLQVLNWFWWDFSRLRLRSTFSTFTIRFAKMMTALKKRFHNKSDGHKVVNGHGHVNGEAKI
jgi:hypothetical protein